MKRTRKTIRVFVSSTFEDLKAERNALQQHVFPKLRHLCAAYGWRFEAIDLRWGVSEEAGLDQRTMRIRLEELRQCQRVSPRPNFVVLLGERYGWRPLPEEIPADEFVEIKRRLRGQDTDLLHKWYRRDDNAVPPVYLLQPRTGRFTEHGVWATEIEGPLQKALCQAVQTMSLDEQVRLKYEASATEQEIHAGALSVEDANEHVLAFFRTIRSLPSDASAASYVDLDKHGNADPAAKTRLDQLKVRIDRHLRQGNVVTFEAEWTQDGLSDAHLEALCAEVEQRLTEVIEQEVSRFEETDPLQFEIEQHERFGDERTRFFVGRESVLGRVANYLDDADNRHPLCVHGESGTGKTALMARAERLSRQENSGTHHVVRFIGATPGSSNGRALLETLSREISECYGADAGDLPLKYRDLVAEFPKRLALATRATPLIVFLDALDQLSHVNNARSLIWLPRELPENVRVVISMTDEEFGKSWVRHLGIHLPLQGMPSAEGIELLDCWLADAGRSLQEAQRDGIVNKFKQCPLPLYLKLAFEQARLWHSYDGVVDLSADIPGILHDLFERLSVPANHGPLLVERVLSCICCARHGLSEEELLEVLAQDEEYWNYFLKHAKHDLPAASFGEDGDVESASQTDSIPKPQSETRNRILPVVIWSRLHHDLAPYMTERAAAGTSLLDFYHCQFGSAVENRYLADPGARAPAHERLSEYFRSQADPTGDGRWQGREPPRGLGELPYHLAKCQRWHELVY